MNKTTLIISEGTKEIRKPYDQIEKIIIPDSAEIIEEFAFSGCSSLTEITIPDSIISIGYRAFYKCSSLTKINIPNSVTSIGECAFKGCESLKAIYIDKEKDSLDLSNAEIPKGCKVYWRGEFEEVKE